MPARIYRPAKTAMQSGEARTKEWVLDFEPAAAAERDPLMGWSSSSDTLAQVRLEFASKEEAVLEYLEGLLRKWLDRLRDRPAGEHVWDSIEAAALEVAAEIDYFDELCAMCELVEQSPALISRGIEIHTRTGPMMVEAIAARAGCDADTDIYPALLNYCAVAAIRAAIDLWRSGNSGAQSPEELIRAAFDRLRQGIS